jgi:hypothetical protein
MDDQRRARPDGADVGADIDDVGGGQEHDEQTEYPQAVPVLDVLRQALAGDVADPAAGLLDAGHQRQHPQGGPQLPVTELGASLGVGRDARRVAVGGPGNQAGAEDAEQVAHLVTRRVGGFAPLAGRPWRRNV